MPLLRMCSTMSYMNGTLSIRIDPGLRRNLRRAARRQKRKESDLAREAIRRYLAVDEFRRLRAATVPLAEARGILTDEDVFRLIS